jgi:hypothetical protein
MNIAKVGLVALMLCSQSHAVLANQVKEMSLEEKSAKSDLVIIGQVEELDCCASAEGSRMERLAAVRVETSLKGGRKEQVKVRYRSGIAEFDPDCCELGKRYVFFLKLGRDGIYQSVNARFGIYAVGTNGTEVEETKGTEGTGRP